MAYSPSSTRRRRAPLSRFVSRFRRANEGSISVELVIVLPMLLWALAASVVFYDGFRNRYHAQMAAQTVADIMSRETDMFTADYIEGLNHVFDFLADSRYPTRIRVSSVIWDSANERNMLQWSYATRDLSPLPEQTFELLDAGDEQALLALFGDDDSFSFAGSSHQMPVADLAERIPPVLPGEALLLVESFALWTPFTNVGVGQMRFAPVVVVRPRFAPWINFDGIDPVYPEDNYEIAWTGGGGNDSLPDPNEPVPDDPDPDPDPDPAPGNRNMAFDFESGVTTGWSANALGNDGPTGAFLGPFGHETWDTPVTLDINLGTPADTATIRFDLLIIDKWKGFDYEVGDDLDGDALPRGDALTIMIDGTPIALEGFLKDAKDFYGRDRVSVVNVNGATYRVTMTARETDDNFYGRGDKDQIWEVAIGITNAPAAFQLGFSAGLNDDIDREAFGIDNLRVAARGDGSGAQVAPIPDPSDLIGTDPFTRFPQYAGCPDPTLPGQWLTMDLGDLKDGVEIMREAGGYTNLSTCQSVRGFGFVEASPDLIFNFTHDEDKNDRLEIRMDDDDDGYTCDTTLIVRDPNGQYWFNDDFDRWNAGLRLGHAPEGVYHVWVGTYGGGTCQSQLIIEKQ